MPTTLAPLPTAVAVGPAIEAALQRVPPLWPLTHFVAVNPFVGLLDRPFAEACTTLQRTVGAAPVLSPAEYLAARWRGEIHATDLRAVATDGWTDSELVAALEHPDATREAPPLATVADLLDAERPHAHWSAFITDEISKWCGVMFDENQTTWRSPWRHLGLYAAWREGAARDHNPEAFGLTGFRAFVAHLPADSSSAIDACLRLLAPPGGDLIDFLHRQIATISGWAGHVQYLVREDALRGRTNPALRDLLAIRLAYDAALFQAFRHDRVFLANWRNQPANHGNTRLLDALVRWQRAYERGYQHRLALSLAFAQPTMKSRAPRPILQAIFCIDVRSEVFRRHLESAAPGAQTIGFAGFFGFPVSHQPATGDTARARCPVLLLPSVHSTEPQPAPAAARARSRRTTAGAWKAFQDSAASCFSFVEAAGLAFGAALATTNRSAPTCARVAPEIPAGAGSLENRAAMAEGALRNMSLTGNFSRLVLVCGHGSQSANNPYASALECGACGGHAGDVNARLAAAVLNDAAVRERLTTRGVALPADTVFVAGLHHTTTDDVVLFDLDRVPASHASDLAALRTALVAAGAVARAERAGTLGLTDLPEVEIDAALRRRAGDIAQVRPEWGLANNAAFVAAPRHRTAALNLRGRVFLHDYDAATDSENRVLSLILSAPVVVASWINLQYYASRVDPDRYGAGNKVLHNICGGIGALEGNGGDLKVGLPLQSIHDGSKFMHEPRRLSVYLDAPRSRIGVVLAAQPAVRALFDHGWIHLVALEGDQAYAYEQGHWTRIEP